MIFLGAVIGLASIPGLTSFSIPAGWAALSILLPLTLWKEARLTSLHILFLAFLAFAALGLAWTPDWKDGVWRLWQLSLIFLAFRLGSISQSIEGLIVGLAIAGIASSIIAAFQWLGFNVVLAYSTASHAGLFYNPSIAGQTLALIAVACLAFDRWSLAIALVPGIALTQARGGWTILALGFVLNLFRRIVLLGLAILATLAFVLFSASAHDAERSLIWRSAILYLTTFGQGPGSFISLFISTPTRVFHPTDVHNDLLQLLFEFGILGLAPVAIFCAGLLRTDRPEWVPLACFVYLSFFAFPLFVPISACLGALCAGRIAACGDWSWSRLSIRRPDFLHWPNPQGPIAGDPSQSSIPVQSRTT